MKQNLILVTLLLFLTINALCQTNNANLINLDRTKSSNEKWQNDTLPNVEIRTKQENGLVPLYYINGIHYNSSILRTINPKLIDSISVLKEEKDIGDTYRNGRVYIKMKREYRPKLISLIDLKQKYAIEVKKPTIFMIDNEIVEENYTNFLIDEKYILSIIIDNIKNEKENIDIQLIRLTTRTEDNVNQANHMSIRGNVE